MKRLLLWSLAIVIVFGFVGIWHKYTYPYGGKPARLPVVMMALRSFASEHEGAFPNVNKQPLASLVLLYPRYLADPVDLAGITGDEKAVVKNVVAGEPLDGSICSWVYWPGFNDTNDARIAVLWEEKSGVGFNGHRLSGHAVGFVDGSHTQIPEQRWNEFLTEQTQLRAAALK